MGELIYQWIDVLWLPVAWFAVHKQHRLKAIAFVVTCMLVLRTQVELIESTGYPTGYLPIMDSPVFTRGLIVYSLSITLFLVLAHYSPRTTGVVFLAAGLTIFFGSFCLSMILMVL